ncbi:carboxylating nicotinate-nucleotide diphosphorylase [Alkalihalophilus marmarensis]|uniref:carboxylating nicotinate-nucleotide diphosphorylase n=1 Tax=Alkalihalophilus marmarensis TaxID=521377 RepID=UPI002DB92761|nr:carboxylating nicotinate-nucleotide diphosphorylase [Alkalihalophilus marmarensis]MEC2072357.1 carboxylating nicotinate-nucleotide diphosphorylase [Alkalihalophilus marmarensis]
MNKLMLREQLIQFFSEDIGHGDLTSEAIFDNEKGKAYFLAKDEGIFCGEEVIFSAYQLFDPAIEVIMHKKDGDAVRGGEIICEVYGKARDLLTSERVILNIIQRLSGIATETNKAVKQMEGTSIRICDTRKTTPGLRMLEKYAVTCGGGFNHRFGLHDAVLIKDNHIAQCGGDLDTAVKRVKEKLGHMVKVEVEVESCEEVKRAVTSNVDVIMFDNCSPTEAKDWRELVPDSIVVELSGGITLHQLEEYAHTGVDYISMGALTHSVKALDISLDVLVKEGVSHA